VPIQRTSPLARDVLCVVTNYNSPRTAIVATGNAVQTGADVVVIDNSGGEQHAFRCPGGLRIRDVWRFGENAGPPCRFAPAWQWSHRYKYVLFLDDDVICGPRCIETCLQAAKTLDNKFATIGANGRWYGHRSRQWHYVKRTGRPRRDRITHVDLTCRAHFVRADLLWQVGKLREDLVAAGMPRDSELLWEDDILLCQAIQRETGWPSALVPATPRDGAIIAQSMRKQERAMSSRPQHLDNRTAMIRACAGVGWRRAGKMGTITGGK
jgi:hypothetical protein